MHLYYLKFTGLQKKIHEQEGPDQIQTQGLPFSNSPNLSSYSNAHRSSSNSSLPAWHHRRRVRSEAWHSTEHPTTPTLRPHFSISRSWTARQASLWQTFAEARQQPSTRPEERLHLDSFQIPDSFYTTRKCLNILQILTQENSLCTKHSSQMSIIKIIAPETITCFIIYLSCISV